MNVTVRPARPEDAAAMCAVLNAIIRRGGTTAHQQPFDPAGMIAHYIAPPDNLACHVAEIDGTLVGFQSVVTGAGGDPPMPAGRVAIGTFVAEGMQGKGVGQALFAATRKAVLDAGFRQIEAVIRADNRPGLAYYSGLGFRDDSVMRQVPLDDGRPVDRLRKLIDL